MAGAAALPVLRFAVGAETDGEPADRQRAGPGGNDRKQKLHDERKHGQRNQRRAKFSQSVLASGTPFRARIV
jgi:hypothetical protein